MSYVKDAELTLVVGRRGSGKSTLTKGLLKQAQGYRSDPQAEYGGRGWVRCDVAFILKEMRKRWASDFVSPMCRSRARKSKSFRDCATVFSANAPYNDYADPRKADLVVERQISRSRRTLPVGSTASSAS